MPLHMRMYQSEDDYWRIRAFLRELYFADPRREQYWLTARLDYWRWHVNENIEQLRFDEVIFFWETPEGEIGAVLHPEGRRDAYLQVHPRCRTADQLQEMVQTAEAHLSVPDREDDRRRRLMFWLGQHDALQQAVLHDFGYQKGDWPEYQRWRSLDLPIPEPEPAEGYTVRALGEIDELPARSWASWRAFHPDEPDADYEGWDWYLNVQRCPLYRRDLDLVAVAPDGSIAGFTTVWFDDVTRTGLFEPVGIIPEHQKRGLGKALMHEGLRRLKRLGATCAVVGGYSDAANALYSAVMSPEYTLIERWQKTFVP
jgi:mycothiol synthase